jgi:NAD-dependent SIR2 family protein deacetylase
MDEIRTKQPDLMIVIGTSLKVAPFNSIAFNFKGPVVLINRENVL